AGASACSTLRQAQGRPEQGRGVKATSPSRLSAQTAIPPGVCVLRLHAERRDDERHPCRGMIDERKQQVAPIKAQSGSAVKKERDVSTDRFGDGALSLEWHAGAPERCQRADRCCRIAAAATQTRLR